MARDKERSVNPAQQQRKLEKAKQLKKSRAELQSRRNEKLARRNPDRLQRQIDDLKALESSGEIKPREKAILEELERDLKAVQKAREALGEKAPHFGGQQRRREGEGNNVLGKRRHDGERKPFQQSRHESSGSDTDDSVRRIPMPEDTPPPIPREFRRNFRNADNAQQADTQLPSTAKPVPVAKTTYESAPQVRDLRKEAVNRFVPDVVRKKQEAAKGGPTGRLIEPEEMDRLEAEGYVRTEQERRGSAGPAGEDQPMPDEVDAKRLAEEEQRFLRELEMQDVEGMGEEDTGVGRDNSQPQKQNRHVEIEEVEDEDA
ncbi:WW domain binding protein 11-domain-containing protein [Exophiala viscosa]|uniref:WW domain binding protein 11-domain-containing protein n=1 Tax=Exophiala viscosa TaxID=2486360 RepID=A0AAN6E041_9EURO|nr:WW domain binding protein 11-domain-containing protein [Exophiala viscosa]KAI1622351.1 WW domain binding protein 11-domain-containing protein [Exophiala viscosa]